MDRRRIFVASAVLGPWLLLITSRQTALYNGSGGGLAGAELIATPITLAVMVVASALRFVRPSSTTHVACLAALIAGLALLAAQLGSPFANASADYCGDFCRTAIMGRFVAFFGWPLVAGMCLTLASRWERGRPVPGAAERARWSRAWLYPTVVFGFLASVAWWRIVMH